MGVVVEGGMRQQQQKWSSGSRYTKFPLLEVVGRVVGQTCLIVVRRRQRRVPKAKHENKRLRR